MQQPSRPASVVVIGAGNAGLNAALAARRSGAQVRVLESATPEWRGGNSKYTRNMRVAHAPGDDVMSGEYTVEELAADLDSVNQGEPSDPELTAIAINRSLDAPAWAQSNGARWQAAMRGTLQLGRTNRFFLGGGKALINTYYETATRLGVEISYEHEVTALEFQDDRCTALTVENGSHSEKVSPDAVVIASGGFEANLEWMRGYWGDAAENFYVRGARQNDGRVLKCLLEAGASSTGDPRSFHAVAVDARGPKFEGGIVTRVDAVPFGVMLNVDGQRFYDEGEDLWPKRYSRWGLLVAGQRDQRGVLIFDSQVLGQYMSTLYPPLRADTLEELAAAAGLPVEQATQTLRAYNAAVMPGAYDPSLLDDCHTESLEPPKTHWALRIEQPPFFAYPLVPGITFTYMGVAVDTHTRVRHGDGELFSNVFACGEVMSGNILKRGYLAGFGMTIGTVFGRIAGEEAAAHALRAD